MKNQMAITSFIDIEKEHLLYVLFTLIEPPRLTGNKPVV